MTHPVAGRPAHGATMPTAGRTRAAGRRRAIGRTLRRPAVGRAARGALGAAGLLGAAEAAGRTGLIDPDVLPLVSTVLARVADLPAREEFRSAIAGTVTVWAAGLGIAIALAVPAGIVIGALPLADRLTRPLIELLRPLPPVALIPLTLLIFGGTTSMSVVVVVFACCWPVLLHTVRGLRDAHPIAVDALRSFGFGRPAIMWRVSLPSAAPFIAVGIRLAAGIALIVTITAELFAGGGAGLGTWLIAANSGPGQTAVILAAIAWAGVLGLVADTLLATTSRRLFHWHPSSRTP